ncbi:MHYT domain-containing protein [Massilia sp. MS-15]|uniref:MHYT domain-containing protein n=1 Tax=Massilia sp. MS-15 TaxID=2878200 RepID=UPI001CD235BA|nr:MHYT domain-containing protein [Massilia sp. MS-15]MCA1247289.1 PAS domain S-box protein [Massilia sp. MS-15]
MLQLFSIPDDPSLLTYGVYEPRFVLLSVLIAIFSSWMGLQIAGQAAASRGHRAIVLASGSLALGAGVWAMHFIGMLAFTLCTPVDYDPLATLLSAVPSIGASAVALSLISRRRLGPAGLLVGGVLVGAGIGAMHYAGMAGMQMQLQLRYDPAMFALSIVVAVVLATLALGVRYRLSRFKSLSESRRLLLAAVVMGCAIAGMHYTGMAAARFVGRVAPAGAASLDTDSSSFLALAVALITVVFTGLVVAANGLLRYRQMFLELRRSEAWMRALLTTTVDGVITIARDGTVTEFNASAERIFGWQRAEIVGHNASLLIADDDGASREGLLGIARDGYTAAVSGSSEIMGKRKDGSLVPIRRAIGHARLDQQDLFVCFITDISERRAIMQALHASEAQFRSLIANIPGISFRCTLEGDWPMVFISDAVERVTGYPAADFVGRQPRRLYGTMIHVADRLRVNAELEASLREDRPYLVEYRLLHADGSIRWLWENGSGVRDEAGQVAWLDGVILDITERREMEDALREAKDKAEQAAAARATFVANMSHEIRTPMNSILGFTDVLLDGDLNKEQRRHLDTIRNAGRSLLRLLNEILDTAKLEKGAVELEQNDYNLLSLIDELSSTLAANARAKGLHLDIRYNPALPTGLRGDELRVRQVLTNLLDNAIKFTEQGTVALEVSAEGDQLCIAVSDTGIGIAPERLQAIFDPFTQADASMTRRFGGTGLGTTISKQLVELMGGRIWAESELGKGTTFHVRLPLVLARFAQQAPRVRSAAVLPPLRVLAADDVPQNLELLQLLLARRGHTLTGVADGAAVVDQALHTEFDLVLMDFQMPLLDGLSATRAIRAHEVATGRRRTPVIAMTASVLAEHRRASAEVGMDGFATKPVDWFSLSHEIARVLGLDQQQANPDLAGIPAPAREVLNRRAGLHRWADKADVYAEALAHFGRQYDGLALTLRLHAAGGAHHELRMLAHKVRGVAANVGLEQLSDALSQLEQATNAVPTDERAAAAALEACTAALELALAAIRDGDAPPAAAPAVPAAHDLARARRAGGVLLQTLRRGALDDAALAGLAAALAGHPAAARVAQVQRAIGDFEFDSALEQLEAVMATLDEQEQATQDAQA